MEKDTLHQSTDEIYRGSEALDMSLLRRRRPLVLRPAGAGPSSRGFTARTATSVTEAKQALKMAPPAFAVFDLKLGDGSGLEIIQALKDKRAEARGVILTGYGAIASAVMAVKIGAFDYLAKPANADEVVVALMDGRREIQDGEEQPMSADRVRWEHIQRIYEACEHNVSETARQLNMHSRTFQRIFAKRAPK